MKKLLITIALFVGILSFIGVTVEASEPTYTVNFTGSYGSGNITPVELTGRTYGSKIQFEDNVDDYDFHFWIVNGVVHYDLPLEHEFFVTGNMNIVAVLSDNDHHAVVMMDSNRELLDIQYVTDNGNATDITEDLPDKPGYQLLTGEDKWSTPITNITHTKVVVLQYGIDTSTEFTLEVENGLGDGDYLYNTVVTVTPGTAPAEKVFSHWESNGQIVSYQEEYEFTMLSDKVVTAVFLEMALTPEPIVSISNDLYLRDGHSSFLGQFEIPEGYEIIEYGLFTSSESFDAGYESATKLKAPDHVQRTNEFLISTNTTDNYIQAFLAVETPENQIEFIYSDTKYINWSYEQNFDFVTSGSTSYSYTEQFVDENDFEWDLLGRPGDAEGFALGNAADGSYIELIAYEGIDKLSIDVVRFFTNSNTRSFEVFINDTSYGEYHVDVNSNVTQNITITDIETEGVFTLRIESTSPGSRGAFDVQNIKWVIYGDSESTNGLDTVVKNKLDIPEETTEDLDFPTHMSVLKWDLDIDWESTNTGIISNTGQVTRPSSDAGNIYVLLYATITNGNGYNEVVDFDVLVIAEPEWNKTTETFAGIDSQAYTASGTIQGDSGIEWTFVDLNKSSDGSGDFVQMRNNEPSRLEATFQGGLDQLTVNTMAFGGGRSFDIIINEGEDDEIVLRVDNIGTSMLTKTFTDLGIEGEFTICIH